MEFEKMISDAVNEALNDKTVEVLIQTQLSQFAAHEIVCLAKAAWRSGTVV